MSHRERSPAVTKTQPRFKPRVQSTAQRYSWARWSTGSNRSVDTKRESSSLTRRRKSIELSFAFDSSHQVAVCVEVEHHVPGIIGPSFSTALLGELDPDVPVLSFAPRSIGAGRFDGTTSSRVSLRGLYGGSGIRDLRCAGLGADARDEQQPDTQRQALRSSHMSGIIPIASA